MKKTSHLFLKLKELWNHFTKRKKRLYIFAIFLTVLGGLVEILSLGSLYPFISIILSPDQFQDNELFIKITNFLNITDLSNLALPITILFISMTVLSSILRIVITKINSRLAFSTGVDISTKVFKKTLSQDYIEHVRTNSSEFISAITRKIDQLTALILFPLLTLLASLVNTLAIIITLLMFKLIFLFLIKFILSLV